MRAGLVNITPITMFLVAISIVNRACRPIILGGTLKMGLYLQLH